MKTKFFLTIFLIIFAITYSCSYKELDDMDSSKPYLELMNGLSNLSAKDYLILEEAQKRIDPYVEIKNNRYDMKISCGKDVGVSESIFNIFAQAMEKTNKEIENGEMYIINGKLIRAQEMSLESPRIKTRSGESGTGGSGSGGGDFSTQNNDFYWGSISKTTCDQAGALNYYKSASDQGSAFTTVMGIAAGSLTGSKNVGFVVAVLGYGYTSIIGDALFAAAKNGGIIITTTYRTVGTNPGVYTTVTNHNGDHIISF